MQLGQQQVAKIAPRRLPHSVQPCLVLQCALGSFR